MHSVIIGRQRSTTGKGRPAIERRIEAVFIAGGHAQTEVAIANSILEQIIVSAGPNPEIESGDDILAGDVAATIYEGDSGASIPCGVSDLIICHFGIRCAVQEYAFQKIGQSKVLYNITRVEGSSSIEKKDAAAEPHNDAILDGNIQRIVHRDRDGSLWGAGVVNVVACQVKGDLTANNADGCTRRGRVNEI